jgi:tellurite resistance protein TerC
MQSIGTWWMWLGFIVFILLVLAIDLFFVGGKKSHKVSVREAGGWLLVWMVCALVFNTLLWWYLYKTQGLVIAHEKALQFFTGYIIEQSLSTDNMFAFLMIFSHFHVPQQYQRRVLLYGVLSAIILRLVMILSGTWLVSQFHWVLYIFGVILIWTGIKLLLPEKREEDLERNFILVFLRRHIRITHQFRDEKFFTREKAIWYATPLFLVMVLIEISDLIFALDSIPAIFAITNDPFIIFTSNIFAILGLRALYFLLADMANRFRLLKYGIALVLVFIGIKMLLAHWVELPILLALGMIIAILGTTVVLSVLIRPKDVRK